MMLFRSSGIGLLFLLLISVACSVEPPREKISEVEELYQKGQYTNAMNVARFNLSKDPKDAASIVTVWKVQVLQGDNSADYAQQFYFQAQERVKEYGEVLIPYLGRGLMEDPYNTVRLFCLYGLSEFDDSLSTSYIARVFEPTYELGNKPSDITLEMIRAEAATVLASRNYSGVYDDVVALADSENEEVVAKVTTALGLMGDDRAVPVLEQISERFRNDRQADWIAEMADSTIAKLKRGQ